MLQLLFRASPPPTTACHGDVSTHAHRHAWHFAVYDAQTGLAVSGPATSQNWKVTTYAPFSINYNDFVTFKSSKSHDLLVSPGGNCASYIGSQTVQNYLDPSSYGYMFNPKTFLPPPGYESQYNFYPNGGSITFLCSIITITPTFPNGISHCSEGQILTITINASPTTSPTPYPTWNPTYNPTGKIIMFCS